MAGGSQNPFGHKGSVDGTIPEPYGVDPSIAPGLARPQGWRVALPDGTGAWDKVGPLDTDWQLVGSGAPGDVTDVVAGDAGVVITNSAGPIVTVGQVIAAEWPIANFRIYAVDFVSGNDANAGFADAAGTSSAQYAAAVAAAGAVAKKTFAGLAAIFPKVGNGRLVEIVIANGGSNTAQAYVGGLDTFLGVPLGWGRDCPIVRGTGTNTTAGCTKFDGSTADFDYQGGITVPGLNVAGYNPSGASTTSLPCVLAGGGAPALPAEPNAPLGWRVRFDAATATVALRNQCRQIAQVAGTTTITPQTAFSAAPANTDVFYIEQAGITCDATVLSGGLGTPPSGLTAATMQISGVRFTGALQWGDVHVRMAFCGGTTTQAGAYLHLVTAQSIIHPVLGTRTIGGGMVQSSSGSTSLLSPSVGFADLSGFVTVGDFNPAVIMGLRWGAGSYAGRSFLLQNALLPTGFGSTTPPQVGIAAALARPRVQGAGGMQIFASMVQLAGMTIENAGAVGAIRVVGRSIVVFGQAAVTGTTGNTDVGLDLTGSQGSLILLSTTPTVTGTLGNVRLAGGQIVTWAQAIATGIVDSAGNMILGTAGSPPLGMDTKSGSILSGVAAAASWVADDSWTSAVALGANNNVFQQRWPTSFRLMTRLRLMLCNPEPTAQAVSATLYKNGVATAMTCTLPIGSMNFDKVVDTAHPILFLDGDDWAVRLNTGIMGAEGPTLYLCTATVEWAT